MDLELQGKQALITGRRVGIGLAIAEGLSAEGVDLILCARNRERLEAEAKRIAENSGRDVVPVVADVSVAAEVDALIESVRNTFGGIDVLINNAGTGSRETILEATDEEWQYYWDLHVMAAIRLARGLAPTMKERGGGVILNNASICAKQPLGYEPIYNTTKAALVMASKGMANEFIQYGIRVNTVNPGLVMTPDWQNTAKMLTEGTADTWEDYLDKVAKDNAPIGRFASTKEIADFFVFLCSARASYSVGSSYYVDGGWLNVIT